MFFRKYLVLVLLFLWLINCSSFGYISESFHHLLLLCYWFWWEFWVLLSFRMSARRGCWCTHHMQFNYSLIRKGYPESQPFHHFFSLKCLRKLQTEQHVASTVILPMALSFFFFFPDPILQGSSVVPAPSWLFNNQHEQNPTTYAFKSKLQANVHCTKQAKGTRTYWCISFLNGIKVRNRPEVN